MALRVGIAGEIKMLLEKRMAWEKTILNFMSLRILNCLRTEGKHLLHCVLCPSSVRLLNFQDVSFVVVFDFRKIVITRRRKTWKVFGQEKVTEA